ncbi:MAG: molybdopterin molybdotransferase MoeA [Phycisphaeraceae bacterium]
MKHAETRDPLPSYDDALKQVLSQIRSLHSEPVELSGALGCVLAEDIVADRDQPPFNRSAMDGYAVRSAEIEPNTWYEVAAVIPAGGAVTDPTVLIRGVSAIATGAAVPDTYDAVIPVEQSHEQNGRVRFDTTQVKPGQHIHKQGDDARAGRVVIPAGTVMGPAKVGIAAAVGCIKPRVIRRACVSILTTGDEVRPPATPTDDLAPQQIRNSNGPMLEALMTYLNTERFDQVHVRDEPDATLAALQESLNKCDLTLTVGGVSAGRRDHVPWAAGELGMETIVKGVAIQPGKPVFIAKSPGDSPRWLVGLPGNPVSVLTTAHLFVWPILRAMSGRDATLPWRSATLDTPVKPNAKREAFRTAEVIDPESLRVSVLHWKGSGDLSHTARAEGFVRLPVQPEELNPGSTVPFLPMIGGGA